MFNDKDALKLARLEGFEAGINSILQVVTGKPAVSSSRGPGRPFGARNRPRSKGSVASIASVPRKRAA